MSSNTFEVGDKVMYRDKSRTGVVMDVDDYLGHPYRVKWNNFLFFANEWCHSSELIKINFYSKIKLEGVIL